MNLSNRSESGLLSSDKDKAAERLELWKKDRDFSPFSNHLCWLSFSPVKEIRVNVKEKSALLSRNFYVAHRSEQPRKSSDNRPKGIGEYFKGHKVITQRASPHRPKGEGFGFIGLAIRDQRARGKKPKGMD